MIYLKKTVLLLACEKYRKEGMALVERLQRAGVEGCLKMCDDGGIDDEGMLRKLTEDKHAAGKLQADKPDSDRLATDMWAADILQNADVQDATLYVTDASQIAQSLIRDGFAVLAFLHSDNCDENFSCCKYVCEEIGELEIEYLDMVFRRYRRIPWDILETERCMIRETTEGDVEAFYRIYSEPSITKYMEGLYEDPEQERAYARDYIDQVYAFYNFGIWTVVEKATGEVIGRAGICYREGCDEPEIGFVIGVPWQGKGLATEVCRAVLRYAKEVLEFPRLLAFVQPENEISLHICRKLGLEIRYL